MSNANTRTDRAEQVPFLIFRDERSRQIVSFVFVKGGARERREGGDRPRRDRKPKEGFCFRTNKPTTTNKKTRLLIVAF